MFREPLAQLVEHLTFNQGVTGSSPVWLTIKINAGVAELADAHDSKSCSVRSVGSTPTFGTNLNEKQKRNILVKKTIETICFMCYIINCRFGGKQK